MFKTIKEKILKQESVTTRDVENTKTLLHTLEGEMTRWENIPTEDVSPVVFALTPDAGLEQITLQGFAVPSGVEIESYENSISADSSVRRSEEDKTDYRIGLAVNASALPLSGEGVILYPFTESGFNARLAQAGLDCPAIRAMNTADKIAMFKKSKEIMKSANNKFYIVGGQCRYEGSPAYTPYSLEAMFDEAAETIDAEYSGVFQYAEYSPSIFKAVWKIDSLTESIAKAIGDGGVAAYIAVSSSNIGEASVRVTPYIKYKGIEFAFGEASGITHRGAGKVYDIPAMIQGAYAVFLDFEQEYEALKLRPVEHLAQACLNVGAGKFKMADRELLGAIEEMLVFSGGTNTGNALDVILTLQSAIAMAFETLNAKKRVKTLKDKWQGIANQLAKAVLANSIDWTKADVPTCPYVTATTLTELVGE